MSAIKDMLYDIMEALEEGELTYAQIAEKFQVPIEWVEEASCMADEAEYYDGQPDEAQEWHDYDPDC
jgi:hypothetical protein